MNREVLFVDDVNQNVSFEKIRMLWRGVKAINSLDIVDVKLILLEGLQEEYSVSLNKRHSGGILMRGFQGILVISFNPCIRSFEGHQMSLRVSKLIQIDSFLFLLDLENRNNLSSITDQVYDLAFIRCPFQRLKCLLLNLSLSFGNSLFP